MDQSINHEDVASANADTNHAEILKQESTPEEILKSATEMMEKALSQKGNPNFKLFWDARKSCLEQFKANMAPPVRAQFWAKYQELTKEARRPKEIFEEQSSFAAEQIEMAVVALEKDIANFVALRDEVNIGEFPTACRALKGQISRYLDLQKEIHLLSTQATRINGLRKELIKTGMRIKQKNQFFQRLSAAGDLVFPKRKELIKEISECFIQDVEAFVNTQMTTSQLEKGLHHCRDEIKMLQFAAKFLTLNTQAFTQTRLKLSEAWDEIRLLEKERKKVQAEQRQAYQAHVEGVRVKIAEFKTACEDTAASVNDLNAKSDEIFDFMRTQELGRDEQKMLRDELNLAKKPLLDRMQEEKRKRQDLAVEKEKLRQQVIREMKEKIAALIKSDVNMGSLNQIRDEILALDISKGETDALLRLLVPVEDQVSENEELHLLELPADKEEALKQLKIVLRRREQKKAVIKETIEKLRKVSGGSGLDFEQSLQNIELQKVQKERMERVSHSIAEVEAKIAKLQKA